MRVDAFGFEREADGSNGTFCLALKGHFADKIRAELGDFDAHDWQQVVARIDELQRREREVYAGRVPCPLAATCKLYQRALAEGKMIRGEPSYRQLSFLH